MHPKTFRRFDHSPALGAVPLHLATDPCTNARHSIRESGSLQAPAHRPTMVTVIADETRPSVCRPEPCTMLLRMETTKGRSSPSGNLTNPHTGLDGPFISPCSKHPL